MKQIIFLLISVTFCFPAIAAVKKKPGETTQGTGVVKSQGQVKAPKGTPTYEIQEIERKMEQYKTEKNLSAAQKANNRKIKREILNSTFDLKELCRLALDKHWKDLSDAERDRFVSLMTNLLETKSILAKEQSKTKGKAYLVRYQGDTYYQKKTKAKTKTEVFVPKENITVNIEYFLRKNGADWKVFDIVVDDASLVENYRYQFNNIISKHGYSELVNRMNKKLSELKDEQKTS